MRFSNAILPRFVCASGILLAGALWSASAAPSINAIPNASVPAGKSLIVPITAVSSNGLPLAFLVASSTNAIAVQLHTNNPFWKLSVVQATTNGAPGAYTTSFRGAAATVTNVGDMTFMLFRDLTPHTVEVFQGLTAGGMYTSNTIFHRVIAGFMDQGGDPQTNGLGGPVFRYDDEWNPQAIFSGSGQLALANSGRDTDGSQFFITVAPYRYGDFSYTIFGQLLRGFNVLSNINNTLVDTNSRPLANVIITRASFVPDTTDTVLTLSSTNLVGVNATIKVIATDGAGGWATNTFTAATVADPSYDQAFILPNTLTNLTAPINVPITNYVAATNLQGSQVYWFDYWGDYNSTNTTISSTNGLLVVKPNAGFTGATSHYIVVSTNANWPQYYQFGYSVPYDLQLYTFAFGDTPISAVASNFAAVAGVPFTNRFLASFTNGVANSAATNFTALVNWGDNSTNSTVITTNSSGRKFVWGAHTYTNGGDYPVYLTIQSTLGASATVVCTSSVPPFLTYSRSGINNLLSWPAWAYAYHPVANTNVAGTNWVALTNLSSLSLYQNVLTNASTNHTLFLRLER